MPFQKVATVNELVRDSVIEVMVAGRPIALCNSSGAITALDGVCPHRGGPLGHGALSEEGRLVCPWHLWEFDCATGEYDYNPETRLDTFEVKVEGDDVYVQVP